MIHWKIVMAEQLSQIIPDDSGSYLLPNWAELAVHANCYLKKGMSYDWSTLMDFDIPMVHFTFSIDELLGTIF